MHSIGALALAAAPLFLVARADLDFDGEDLPAACRSICGPMVQLTQRCDASDLFDNDDARENEYERVEDRLRAQCVCTNDSFDVANIASTCADCIRQNLRTGGGDDDDDFDDELQDINDIIRTCSFATTATWASTASDAANSITVVASAPTAASQLTTTIGGGGNGNGNGNGAPSSTQGQTGPNTTQGKNGPDSTSNNDNNDNNDDNNNNNDNNDNDPDSFAAPGAVPLGGLSAYSVLCGFGAFVAGAAVLVL